MNRLIQISFAGLVLTTGVFALPANDWLEQWHKAKFGRHSAAYEAAARSDQSAIAYREDRTKTTRSAEVNAPEGIPWREQWFKAKYGRYSAAEEARQRGEQIETAYREERHAVRETSPYRTNEHLEQWYKAKFGRFSPMEEARRRGQN